MRDANVPPFKLWAFGGDRRLNGYVLQSNQRPGYSVVRNYGSLAESGTRSSLSRFFSHYKVPNRALGRGNESVWRSYYAKNFHTAFRRSRTSTSSVNNHAHLAWKRLNHMRTYERAIFRPISRIACAVSLAFTRYNAVPGVLGLAVGEVALAQRTSAQGQYFPTREVLYTRAQNAPLYFSSVAHSIFEGVVLIFRALYLAILFSPAFAMAPFADMFGVQFRKRWLQLVHRTLENAGPAFIKWGQWAATRPDLFPKDMCVELAKLHAQAPAHSFSYSKVAVEKAFGRKLSEIFDCFEETPVASGSIAQVHRASLRYRYAGRPLKKPIEVAVKVRHPGVGESIRRDFVIMNLVAKASSVIPALNWLRLDESVRQFAAFMMSQVDLAREAAHLSRFIYNFRRCKDVSFPKPIYPLVHPSVLVETYEQGDCVSRYLDDLEGNTRTRRYLADIGTDALLEMLLEHNYIHGDLHPGNILVREPPKKHLRKKLFRSKPHIIFLDVGMTAELSKSDHLLLLEFFKAVAVRDGRSAAECILKLSKRQSCPNPKAFVEEVDKSFTFYGTREGDKLHPAECMHQLLEQVRRHKVNIDGNICTVMVTILVLEGWQRKLDPNFDIMYTLKTHFVGHKLKSRISP